MSVVTNTVWDLNNWHGEHLRQSDPLTKELWDNAAHLNQKETHPLWHDPVIHVLLWILQLMSE